MANFQDVLKKYVNSSYEELLGLCRASLSQLCEILGKHFESKETSTLVMLLFGTCIGADGKLTALECKFVNDLLGQNMSTDEVLELANTCADDQSTELLDKLADSLPAEEKSVLLSACLCFLAVDETISVDEIKFLEKLIVE